MHELIIYISISCANRYTVGETKGRHNKRMCGHRSDINLNAIDILHQHFNEPDNSIVSVTVRIFEIIYHKTNNPQLSTPLRRQKEAIWNCDTLLLQ